MKLLIIAAAVLSFSIVSQARPDLDGCGLGWEITQEETLLATATRGTTNSFVPPAFGMTTGTLGCKKLQIAANEQESATYVLNNYTVLKQELAQGQGEYTQGLFEVMDCSKASQIKSNYNTVVAPAKDGADLYNSLKAFCS